MPHFFRVVQGDEGTDMHENDFATCTVSVSLERLRDAQGASISYMPARKEEGWWLLLGDPSSNTLFAGQKARSSAHALTQLLVTLTRIT